MDSYVVNDQFRGHVDVPLVRHEDVRRARRWLKLAQLAFVKAHAHCRLPRRACQFQKLGEERRIAIAPLVFSVCCQPSNGEENLTLEGEVAALCQVRILCHLHT